MSFFDNLVSQLRAVWESLTAGQRAVLGTMIVTVGVGAVAFSAWIRKPEMAVLTSGANMSRAGEIVKVLDSKGVDYRVANGGRTILVEKGSASELAVLLAADGLVGDSPGGNILDSKNVGMLPAPILRDNLRRVLQADLGRMIGGLRAVESAQVQLAIPEESVFVEDHENTTASVLVRLRGGMKLTETQVHGIANLVSSGVEGMEAANVSIVDNEGRVLWGDATDAEEMSMVRLQKKKEIERHLADKATRMLTRVVGNGHAVASVNADLSWDQTETKKRSFDPKHSSVRSEERDESSQGGNTTESSVTNYELDETSLYVSSRGAKLENMTVSVAVDYRPIDDGGNVTWEKIPDGELEELRALVMTAVGFDEDRGDKITVVNQRFSTREAAPSGGFFASPLFQALPSILGRLVAVGIALMLVLALKKQLGGSMAPAVGGSGAGVALPGLGATGGDVRRVNPEERFQSIASGNPENVARVMKNWMSEPSSAAEK